MKVNKFVEQPYTNSIGQLINCGDEVIYVGSSWKNTHVKKGKFAGVYIGKTHIYDRETKKYYQTEGVVAVKVTGVPARKWTRDVGNGQSGFVDGTRCAILPLKRVFKIADVSGSQVADMLSSAM
jgi:hypothetical protein